MCWAIAIVFDNDSEGYIGLLTPAYQIRAELTNPVKNTYDILVDNTDPILPLYIDQVLTSICQKPIGMV
jgi:hypothetical protein